MRLGMALALELLAGGYVTANADPWPFVDAMLRGEVDPPQPAYTADVQAVLGTWAKLTDERRALLQLLSRFALSAGTSPALVRGGTAQRGHERRP